MATQIENPMVKNVATLAAVAALRSLFVGSYQDFAVAPTDPAWLVCDGRVLNVADYPVIGPKLGNKYGGNGSTTFGLPDHRGRVMAAIDNLGDTAAGRLTGAVGGVNGAVLGAVGGGETQTLTIDHMPTHDHGGSTGSAGAHSHTVTGTMAGPNDTSAVLWGGTVVASKTNTTSAAPNHSHSITGQGGNVAHNNVQPTITTIRCILAY